jgi:hypothetical protein
LTSAFPSRRRTEPDRKRSKVKPATAHDNPIWRLSIILDFILIDT